MYGSVYRESPFVEFADPYSGRHLGTVIAILEGRPELAR